MSKRDLEREQRWRALMSEWEQSGQTAREFCRVRELKPHTFYGWRRELRLRDGQEPDSSQQPRGRFVQLRVGGPSWLELCMGNELVLRMPTSIEPERLTQILLAARKAGG